jgi:hypothetical protein
VMDIECSKRAQAACLLCCLLAWKDHPFAAHVALPKSPFFGSVSTYLSDNSPPPTLPYVKICSTNCTCHGHDTITPDSIMPTTLTVDGRCALPAFLPSCHRRWQRTSTTQPQRTARNSSHAGSLAVQPQAAHCVTLLTLMPFDTQ